MPKYKKANKVKILRLFQIVVRCAMLVGKSTKEGNPIFLIKKVPLTED